MANLIKPAEGLDLSGVPEEIDIEGNPLDAKTSFSSLAAPLSGISHFGKAEVNKHFFHFNEDAEADDLFIPREMKGRTSSAASMVSRRSMSNTRNSRSSGNITGPGPPMMLFRAFIGIFILSIFVLFVTISSLTSWVDLREVFHEAKRIVEIVGQILIDPPSEPPLSKQGFIFLAAFLIFLPGTPGYFVFFLCGRFYGIKHGLLIAVVGNVFGTIGSFLVSRYVFFACKVRRDRLNSTSFSEPDNDSNGLRKLSWRNIITSFFRRQLRRINMPALERALELEEWRITLLSRFIFLPTQLKNYVFGILPVRLKVFIIMALLGDLSSQLSGVYLGSISTSLQSDQLQAQKQVWSYIGLVVSLLVSIVASFIARRGYEKALKELDLEASSEHEHKDDIDPAFSFNDVERQRIKHVRTPRRSTATLGS